MQRSEAIRAVWFGTQGQTDGIGHLAVEDATGPLIFVESDDWQAWWQAFRLALPRIARQKCAEGTSQK